METHCCFNTSEQKVCSARIHVPLAKLCTMGCIYCNYINDKNITKEFRPGVSSAVISIAEIENYLRHCFDSFPKTEVIGVSGPGEPFDNIQELSMLAEIIQKKYPSKKLCVCTNGKNFSLFKEFAIKYKNVLHYITVTINTFDINKIMMLYESIKTKQQAEELLDNQLNIIKFAVANQIKSKINTVFISKINSGEVVKIFNDLRALGADCFNLMLQISSGNKQQIIENEENINYLECIRDLKRLKIPITKQCKMCRSDFCGY